jgi:hypothetical protein
MALDSIFPEFSPKRKFSPQVDITASIVAEISNDGNR